MAEEESCHAASLLPSTTIILNPRVWFGEERDTRKERAEGSGGDRLTRRLGQKGVVEILSRVSPLPSSQPHQAFETSEGLASGTHGSAGAVQVITFRSTSFRFSLGYSISNKKRKSPTELQTSHTHLSNPSLVSLSLNPFRSFRCVETKPRPAQASKHASPRDRRRCPKRENGVSDYQRGIRVHSCGKTGRSQAWRSHLYLSATWLIHPSWLVIDHPSLPFPLSLLFSVT